MPNRTSFPMYPSRTRTTSALSGRIHRIAAVATLAVAFILLTAYPAYAAVAPASVSDDPLRQASDTTLTSPILTAEFRAGAIELRWDPVPGAVRYKLRVWWDSLPHWLSARGRRHHRRPLHPHRPYRRQRILLHYPSSQRRRPNQRLATGLRLGDRARRAR